MDVKELRSMKTDELQRKAEELREDLARLAMKRYARRLETPSDLRKAKRELARVLTLLGEKKRQQAAGAGQ